VFRSVEGNRNFCARIRGAHGVSVGAGAGAAASACASVKIATGRYWYTVCCVKLA